jgi:hypothetical protein
MSVVEVDFPAGLKSVDDLDALAALPLSYRADDGMVLVRDIRTFYAYDASSVAAPGDTVILPDDISPLQAGRWIKNLVLAQVDLDQIDQDAASAQTALAGALTAKIAAQTAAAQTAADRVQTGLDRTQTGEDRDAAATSAAAAAAAVAADPSKIQTNAATPTTPPSGVSSGDQYWAIEGSLQLLVLYLNTDGTGAEVTPRVALPINLNGMFATTDQRIGTSGAPVSGTAASGTTWRHDTPVTLASSFKEFGIYAPSSGTVTLLSLDADDAVVASKALTVVENLNTFDAGDIGLSIPAGGRYAVYSSTGSIGYLDAPGSYHYYSGLYASGGFTSTISDVALQFYAIFENIDLAVTADSIAAISDDATKGGEAYEALALTQQQIIGPLDTLVDGDLGSDNVWVDAVPVRGDGPLSKIDAFSEGAGILTVYALTGSGDTFTATGSIEITLADGQNALTSDDFGALNLKKGQFVGFRTSTVPFGGTQNRAYYNGGGGELPPFSDSDTTTIPAFQVRFTFDLKVLSASKVVRTPGVFTHQLNFIANHGESVGEGSNGAVTTAQEYDNVGFPAHSTSPTALLPATVANLQYNTRGEFVGLGGLGGLKALITDENGVLYTDNDFQLVTANNALSGQRLDQVNKGTAPYTQLMSQIQSLVNLANGRSVTVQGMILTLGVNDGDYGTSRADYRDGLIQLANDLNADARAITGQWNSPIVFASQTSSTVWDIRLATLDAANISDLIVLTTPMYHLSYYDGTHIDAAGSRLLGLHDSVAMKRTLVDRKAFEPLQPVQSAVRSTIIDLFFATDNLVLDTTLVPLQPNYGFTVVDGSGSGQTISSVSIIAPNRVRIVCASAIGTDWKVRYGDQGFAVPSGGTSTNYTSGGAGNLRDSQGDTIVLDGHPIHNWCVAFEWAL